MREKIGDRPFIKVVTRCVLNLLVCRCRNVDVGRCDSSINEPVAETKNNSTKSATTFTDVLVEASCGECQFGMDGTGCDLAVRIDGKSYYVDGSSIDDHGDAHSDSGLCNCICKAKVSGEIEDGRFVATSFHVVPNDKQGDDEDKNKHD